MFICNHDTVLVSLVAMSNKIENKVRIVTIEAIMACSKQSMSAKVWVPKHDCGDPDCPMKGK